jgi:hypothetical protein
VPLTVNLDAMIRREDLDVTDNEPALLKIGTELKLGDLEQKSPTYNILRKPDFQRETANWEPEKIADLITSFLDGDLIPSVIVWRSNRSGKLFVIDGAHRVSALIAWINDDFGDSGLSRAFFGNVIEDTQQKIARKVRSILERRGIGKYEDLKKYVISPEQAPNELAVLRGRNMGSFIITLEDVKGDVGRAERSFLKINQNATPISPTELIIIQSRRKPNAIATRAMIRAGTGHPYWATFEEQNRERIVALAKQIYESLFKPILEYPIRTLDLPAAGRSLSADSLDLVFNLVNHVNKVANAAKKRDEVKWKMPTPDGTGEIDLADDVTGDATVKFLRAVQISTAKVFGKESGSLALHPGVYCYGATGRFLPTAFFAAIELASSLRLRRRFDKFTDVRAKFEDFVISFRHFINQIAGVYGSQLRGLPALHKMYNIVIDGLTAGQGDFQAIVGKIQQDKELAFVRDITDDDRTYGRNFSRETSNAIYLREAMASELRCSICGARIVARKTTVDHKIRIEDGGMGSPDNGGLTHPYCNDGYKEKRVHDERSRIQ